MSEDKLVSREVKLRKKDEPLPAVDRQLNLLQNITLAVSSATGVPGVLNQITDEVVHSLGYSSAFILLPDEEGKTFKVEAFSTKKMILSQVNKIVGSSFFDLSLKLDLEANEVIRLVARGETVVVRNASEVGYADIRGVIPTTDDVLDAEHDVAGLEVTHQKLGGRGTGQHGDV